METIRLFFFIVRLISINFPFLLKYLWIRSPLTATFLFASLLLFLQITLVILAAQTWQVWRQTVNYYFQDVDQHQQQLRQEQIAIWEDQLAQQPTHRDILLKLAQLHCQDDNLTTCQDYWQQAATIDPNHPQVIEFKQIYLSN